MKMDLLTSLYVFMLAAFIGFEVIRQITPLLHTPLMSLTNALEFQFEAGAVPSVVHHLLQALFEFARAVGVSPGDLGTSYDPGEVLALICPKARRKRPPPR